MTTKQALDEQVHTQIMQSRVWIIKQWPSETNVLAGAEQIIWCG
jgi:hypothetical protein